MAEGRSAPPREARAPRSRRLFLYSIAIRHRPRRAPTCGAPPPPGAPPESRAETGVGASQSRLGIHRAASGQVDDGQEKIADLFFLGGPVFEGRGGAPLLDLLLDLLRDIGVSFPVETEIGRARGHPV